ncbi:protein PFC0760c-like [Trichoplusia ni]|uniref:Protein PFC0760c-like n=1 Tax=Trichoplusia ni TaxID=7111 RepID=A0A7E5VBK7_TRINI|nr:protein PFC0760c-like [Trichoplusia ni]
MEAAVVILLLAIHTEYISPSVLPSTCMDSQLDISNETDETEAYNQEESPIDEVTMNDSTDEKTESDNPSISREFGFDTNVVTHREVKRNTATVANVNSYRPTAYPVLYKKVDPKLIITSPFYPIPQRRVDNKNENEDIDEKFDETISVDLFDSSINLTEIADNNNSLVESAEKSNDTDLFNIRWLRENLLHHLLDYFLNILKDEQHNETVNTEAKDHMKIEDRLRNYYDPNQIDLVVDEDEEFDYDEDVSDDFRRKNYKDKSNLEKQLETSENVTDIDSETKAVKQTWNNEDDDEFIGPNTFLDDSIELVKKVDDDNDSSLKTTTDMSISDDGSSDEEVTKIYSDVITTEAAATVNTDVATGDTTTEYQNFEDETSTIDQIDYYYNEEDEYQETENFDDNDDDENKEDNTTENSDETVEIVAVNNDKINDTNTTNFKIDDFENQANKNNSIQFVVHLQNVDSSQIDGKSPVNASQILTILKKIKDDYKNGNNTHQDHKAKSKGHHCKNNILFNLNINLI